MNSNQELDMNLKEDQNKVYGSALGPDWSFDLAMKGQYKEVVSFLLQYNN